jgi:hypothetical protein
VKGDPCDMGLGKDEDVVPIAPHGQLQRIKRRGDSCTEPGRICVQIALSLPEDFEDCCCSRHLIAKGYFLSDGCRTIEVGLFAGDG